MRTTVAMRRNTGCVASARIDGVDVGGSGIGNFKRAGEPSL
jgi:hypothetical protein